MANHKNVEHSEDEFDVDFRIRFRRQSLQDPLIQDQFLPGRLGGGLSHHDVEVRRDGRYVVATEEEFENLRQLAEKAQHQRFVADAEAQNAEKDRRAKLPEKERRSLDTRKAFFEGNPLSLAGMSYSKPVGQFSIKIQFPKSFNKRFHFPPSAQAWCEIRDDYPNTLVQIVRKANKQRGISQRTIRVPIGKICDSGGYVLDEHELARVFEQHAEKSGSTTRRGSKTRASRTHNVADANQRWSLVVRLKTPTEDNSSWTFDFCGSNAEDESVVVGSTDESFRKLSKPDQNQLFEFLHRERERVADLWKPFERIVPPATATTISPAELVELLSDISAQLEQHEVRIQLPKALIQGNDKRLRRSVQVIDDLPPKPASFPKDVVLKFQSHLALDGEPLSDAELKQLAEIREPLIQMRGKWIYIDSFEKQELQKIVEKILATPEESISFEEAVSKLWFGELQEASGISGLPVDVNLQVAELQSAMDEIRNITAPEVALPQELKATLRHYQKEGLNWLAMLSRYGLGACLADDMGLGKTIQTIAWLLHLRENGVTEPALLICPTSVMMNWEKEISKFAPNMRTYRHHGGDRPDSDLRFFQAANQKDLVITSFNLLHRDQKFFRNVSWKWSAVILDEAQNIKNPETKQSQAARSLSRCATNRLALTGTPVENGSRDLWAIMEYLNPGMLGTLKQYDKNIVSPIEHGKGQNQRAELEGKIKPFILRRMKTDEGIASDLPEKIEQNHWCCLTREQAGWYQAALNNAATALDSPDRSERRGAILKVIGELKQICNGVAVLQKDGSGIDTRSGKIQALRDLLIKVVAIGEKAIVFSQYPGQFDKLEEFLMAELESEFGRPNNGRPYGVLSFVGSRDNIKARKEKEREFEKQSRYPVMLISLHAGGTGLNLQAANHVFHLDRWWNAAVEDQATDRAWRIGQDKTVHVHKLICSGTLEERIDELISKKKNLASELLGDVDDDALAQQLSKLNKDDLFDVLSLKESDAVREE